MSRRRRKDTEVSLFPFLSVLACVIGTLVLLLSAVAVGGMGERSLDQVRLSERFEAAQIFIAGGSALLEEYEAQLQLREEAAKDQGATKWQTLRNITIPITLPGLIGVALFGFTLSYDEYPRISNVAGEDNTLPVELVNTLSLAATPTIYAIGTMTTIFSLFIIFTSFIVVYFMQKRRRGFGVKKISADG